MTVEQTLDDREKQYGSFGGHADICQSLKRVMVGYAGWERLTPSQAESLEMIAHKIARILNGDPDYPDNWHDIAGYAVLVERELSK
jgi:hypothetical protein